MNPLHTIWIDGPTGPKAFNYTPSWETQRPGYLREKFRKIQKELQKQERMERLKKSADQDS